MHGKAFKYMLKAASLCISRSAYNDGLLFADYALELATQKKELKVLIEVAQFAIKNLSGRHGRLINLYQLLSRVMTTARGFSYDAADSDSNDGVSEETSNDEDEQEEGEEGEEGEELSGDDDHEGDNIDRGQPTQTVTAVSVTGETPGASKSVVEGLSKISCNDGSRLTDNTNDSSNDKRKPPLSISVPSVDCLDPNLLPPIGETATAEPVRTTGSAGRRRRNRPKRADVSKGSTHYRMTTLDAYKDLKARADQALKDLQRSGGGGGGGGGVAAPATDRGVGTAGVGTVGVGVGSSSAESASSSKKSRSIKQLHLELAASGDETASAAVSMSTGKRFCSDFNLGHDYANEAAHTATSAMFTPEQQCCSVC